MSRLILSEVTNGVSRSLKPLNSESHLASKFDIKCILKKFETVLFTIANKAFRNRITLG